MIYIAPINQRGVTRRLSDGAGFQSYSTFPSSIRLAGHH